MGSDDPIIIAVSLGVSLAALVILLIAARIRRFEEDRGGCAVAAVEPAPLTAAEHFELWTEEMWPGSGSYAARVDELSWFEAWEGRP